MHGDRLRAMCASREVKVGTFLVELATPGIGHICKAAGCDYVLVDCEHSGFHNETVKSVVRYLEAARLPAIVRVPSKEYHHIARALDMGAEGLMLPMVNDAAEAGRIVDCMKYTPVGHRGVALGIAHDAYRAGPVLEMLAAANARTTLFAQIETRAGVDNAEAIAALDGVDCLWVGHFDLSCSLGIPGEFTHPTFRDAIATVGRACRRHGKALGRLVPDVATGEDYWAKGFDFLCYSGDVWLLQAAIRAGVEGLRAVCGGAAPEPASKVGEEGRQGKGKKPGKDGKKKRK
jgi:2-keto-3-deoxy-L-rhamnonate aldolase RhmA